MQFSDLKFKKLIEHYQTIEVLSQIRAVLSWDLNVNLPIGAGAARAQQSAFLTQLIVKKWQDKDFRLNLEKLTARKNKFGQKEQAILRNLNFAGKFYFQVPSKIIVEFDQTTNEAFMVWKQAKEKNNFNLFLPYLKRIIKLNQIIAQHLGAKDNPYDALLNLYEPELTTSQLNQIFRKLTPQLIKLLGKIKKSKYYQKQSQLVGGDKQYPIEEQKKLAYFVLQKIGFDFTRGRIDQSPHPFTSRLSATDVRLTNWYHLNDFRDSLFAALHEGGHGVYEQGVDTIYNSTPLAGGASLGIHESQSRFFENQVGKSLQFLRYLTPIIKAFYPEQLAKVSQETLIRLINQVAPSLIRVEADEVTYNLHIALRFELEEQLINNRLQPKNLTEAWNQKIKDYLGLTPKTDAQGVLQDVHWAYGNFGYFPTYTLGNLYAAQLAQFMSKEIEIGKLLEIGKVGTILSWLKSNIHQHGSLFWPKELIKRVTGRKLSSKYLVAYLNQKYASLYKLK